jgi:hypothetical protein
MRTVTFKSVLDEVVLLKGFQPDQLDLSASQALVMAKYIERWCRKGWEYAFWPEWTLVEARTPVSSVVSLEQAGQTRIGEVDGVFKSEKEARLDYGRVDFVLTASGIDLSHTTGAPATPYIKFRKRPPKFTTEAWSEANTGAYDEGYVVYFPATVSSQLAGECYELQGDGNGSYDWVKQDLPAIMKDVVVMGAYSECLKQEGKHEDAARRAQEATDELHRVHEVVFRQQRR